MPGRGPLPGIHKDDRPLVLVVEDDPANRALLERLMEREGYRTKSVGDGEAALLAVGEDAPDLVLLDIGLPRLDAYEVTRRLRAHVRTLTVPIILLTGRSAMWSRASTPARTTS
jgi:CheY-like chemotaxis protein